MTDKQIQELLDKGYSAEQIAGMIQSQPQEGMSKADMARFALGQGFGWGWGDEIEAAARALFSDRSYTEIRDEIRARLDAAREENQIGALGLEVAGGALSGGVGAGRAMAGAAGRSMLANAGRMAALGGTQGAIAGAGGAEGGLAEHGLGLATGTGLGLALGGAGGAAAQMMGRVTPGSTSGALLKERLAASGLTPQDAIGRMSAMGPGATLAETSPEMRGMVQNLANKPGNEWMQSMLTERQLAQHGLIEDRIRRTMGIEGDPYRYLDEATEARRATAKADYDDLLITGIQPSERLMDLQAQVPKAADTAAQRATKLALARLMRDRGAPRTAAIMDMEPEQVRNLAGYWDYLGRALKRRSMTKAGQVKEPEGPEYLNLKDAMDAELNAATDGKLGQVREAYAIASEGIDAFEQADRFFRMSSRDAIDLIDRLDPEGRQLLEAGVTRTMLEILESKPESANAAWDLIKTPRTTKKMRALLGEDYDAWEKAMRNLIEQTATFNAAVRGSRTAPMLMQEQAGLPGPIGALIRGDFGEAARSAIQSVQRPMPQQAVDELSALMTTQDVNQAASEVQRLLRRTYPAWLPGAAIGGTTVGVY